MSIKAEIKACGSYLPEMVVTNFDLEKKIDTTDQWIVERTGITKRHFVSGEQKTSDLALMAVLDCLSNADLTKPKPLTTSSLSSVSSAKNHSKVEGSAEELHHLQFQSKDYQPKAESSVVGAITEFTSKVKNLHPKNIDCLIVATTTPDLTFPSTSCIVQSRLAEYGINIKFAFDIQAVCAGFVYGLSVASSFIKSGMANSVVVVGADCLSKILNWEDRTTCVLFGDGAGAVLVEKNESESQSDILYSSLYSDGSFCDILKTSGGVGSGGASGYIQMNGKEVFKHAVTKMTSSIEEIIRSNNMLKSEIDFIIAHQANERILNAVSERLDIDPKKFIKTVSIHSNTSAASIPLALDHLIKSGGGIKKGQNVIFEALGAGLTWGGLLVKW